jgi:hypothetical protein
MLGLDLVTLTFERHGIQFNIHDDVTSAAPYMRPSTMGHLA